MIVVNSHGNPTYGGKGGTGKQGDDAPSIYYTPYDSSIDSSIICSIIRDGGNLSNNPEYTEKITYDVNDVIIDTYGNINVIYKDNIDPTKKKIKTIGSFMYTSSETDSSFGIDCSAYFITTNNDCSIDNEYNYLGVDCSSNLVHHRDTRKPKIMVEKIKITKGDSSALCLPLQATDIRFVIIFSDGFVFEKRFDKNSEGDSVFDVDCRYMYERILNDNDSSITSSNEYSYNQRISQKLQNYIKNQCKSYLEFTVVNSQYRIKVNYVNDAQ